MRRVTRYAVPMPTKRPRRQGTGTRWIEAEAAARLDRACTHLAFAEIARLVRMNHETVRLQLLGRSALSVELLARLCLALGLSADAVPRRPPMLRAVPVLISRRPNRLSGDTHSPNTRGHPSALFVRHGAVRQTCTVLGLLDMSSSTISLANQQIPPAVICGNQPAASPNIERVRVLVARR